MMKKNLTDLLLTMIVGSLLGSMVLAIGDHFGLVESLQGRRGVFLAGIIAFSFLFRLLIGIGDEEKDTGSKI